MKDHTSSRSPMRVFLMAAGFFILSLLASPTTAAGVRTSGSEAPTPGALVPSEDATRFGTPATAVAPPIMPGWPQVMGVFSQFYPVGVVLADVDDNGDLEVLAGSTDGLFRVWQHDGTLLPGWPQATGGQVQAKAAAADLDGDGDLEILVSVKTGLLRIYHHDGTTFSGWPQSSGVIFGFVAPTVYDLDGDGEPEVLIGGETRVNAWHADGSPVAGFPVTVSGRITGTLAVGDLIGDSRPEIFAVTTSPGMLHALNADGTVPAGWPFALGLSTSWAAPSIGDLDDDGSREVLVVAYNFGVNTTVFALQGDGSAAPGFPVTQPSVQTFSCPVIGDVDGDGDLEIFNAGKTAPSLWGWDHNGNVLPGWPRTPASNLEGSTILGDFDGDPEPEIVMADNFGPGSFHGYNPDGSNAADFPFPSIGASLPNAPEIGDVDGDGDLDMAMTMTVGQVAIWDFSIAHAPQRVEWGGLFHDNWNTNQYGFEIPGGSTGIAAAHAPGQVLWLGEATPNPFNPAAEISFAIPVEGRGTLTIHDVQGRLLRTLVDGHLPVGRGVARWDGRNDQGRSVPSGVYWLRLAAAGQIESRRLTLVR